MGKPGEKLYKIYAVKSCIRSRDELSIDYTNLYPTFNCDMLNFLMWTSYQIGSYCAINLHFSD